MRNFKDEVFAIFFFLTGVSAFAQNESTEMESQEDKLKIFLCGDVMLGRGIDQALQHSVDPVLYESYIKDARAYVQLAERKNGKIEKPLSYGYIWGDALKFWKANDPALKLINLETSITKNDEPWPRKGIHYRMHPKNVKALTVAGIDYCSLANNHVMDWGRVGLQETLQTLQKAEITYSGAGKNEEEAIKPAVFNLDGNRVLVYAYGAGSSGIPSSWVAEESTSGVNYLSGLLDENFKEIKQQLEKTKEQGDIIIFSIHWGGNWGYMIDPWRQEFAHKLIDEAGVDVVYGHSSHHPKGIEVYKSKLIIYGAGDFLNDYEGISGYEEYRSELSLMYFPEFEVSTGNLKRLKMIPMEIRNFQLHKASAKDAKWLQEVLDRESNRLGAKVRMEEDNSLWLEW